MSQPAPSLPYASPPVPTLAPTPRLDALDLLRGVAILGIFLMNTQSMAFPQWTYTNPTYYSPLSDEEHFLGTDRLVWVIVHLVADMKFITIFSILFGAGVLLQGESAAKKGLSPAAIHYKRMAVLLVFGLIHTFCFWIGDILTTYALCGILLFPLRKLPPWILAATGLLMIAVLPTLQYCRWSEIHLLGLDQLYHLEERLTAGISDWQFQLDAYKGSWSHQMKHRFWEGIDAQTIGFLTWTLWRCGGCILLGMALHKWRFFSGRLPLWLYAPLPFLLIPASYALAYAGVRYNDDHEWMDNPLLRTGFQFNYWGSLLGSLGYISLGILAAKAAAHATIVHTLLHPFRAVGKTALSNYLLQTLIGTTLFYGHGLNWYGDTSRPQLLPIVFTTWAVQLTLSPLYLLLFKQGPIEALWHRLVYGKRRTPQPPDTSGSRGMLPPA